MSDEIKRYIKKFSNYDLNEGYKVEKKEHEKALMSNLELVTSSRKAEGIISSMLVGIAYDHLKEDPKYYQKLRKLGL